VRTVRAILSGRASLPQKRENLSGALAALAAGVSALEAGPAAREAKSRIGPAVCVTPSSGPAGPIRPRPIGWRISRAGRRRWPTA
jgi:hypothetical protein